MSRIFSTSACFLSLCLGGVTLSGCDVSNGISNPFISGGPSHYYAAPPSDSADAVDQTSALRFTRITSEVLLNAEGNFNMVEDSQSIDPAKAHLAARKNVDVRSFKKKAELSPHFSPHAKSGEDGTLRVLRVAGVDNLSDYDVVARRVLRPNTVLDQDASGDDRRARAPVRDYDVIPARKPSVFPAALSRIETAAGDAGVIEAVVKNGFVLRPPGMPPWRMTKNVARVNATTNLSVRQQAQHPQTADVLSSGGIVIPPKREKLVKNKVLFEMHASGIVVPGYKPAFLRQVSSKRSSDGFQYADVARIERNINKTQAIAFNKGRLSADRSQVTEIRAGQHNGNHRIVLELSKKPTYRVKLDALRGVLQMKLDNSDWDLSPQSRFEGSGLFGTYVARQSADGHVLLEVRLKYKTEIIREMILKPSQVRSDGPPVYRLVLDLSAA